MEGEQAVCSWWDLKVTEFCTLTDQEVHKALQLRWLLCYPSCFVDPIQVCHPNFQWLMRSAF